MPKMVILDDGTEEEVWTKDEIEGYKQGSEKNKQRKSVLSKLKETLGEDDENSIIDTVSDLRNSNFAKYRTKTKAMEKELKELGKEFDENGNLITGQSNLTSEDMEKVIEQKLNERLSGDKEANALGNYPDEEKKLIKHYLDKLNAVDNNFEENLPLAIAKAFPDRNIDQIKSSIGASTTSGGTFPRTDTSKKSFVTTDKGLEAMNAIAPAGYKAELINGQVKYTKK